MTNSELDSILKKARLPEFPETDREMLSRQLVARIKNNEQVARPSRSALPRWGWALAVATCVVVAFAIGQHLGALFGEGILFYTVSIKGGDFNVKVLHRVSPFRL